ncbi:MAG: helix-turn-helix transcriptional regulator [Muribaculaceae bacterium]|nr:helix-turn-helix transcriptional regulator [Muribaculaceae bacterium]
MDQSLRITQLSGIKRFSFDYSKFGDDYMFAHFTSSKNGLEYFSSPVRFDGLLFVLCLKGNLEVEINLEKVVIEQNSLLCLSPDRIISSKQTDFTNFEAYFLFLSPQLLRNLNIDINIINHSGPIASFKSNSRTSVIELESNETELLQKYLELLHLNTTENSNDIYIKSISRNIIASTLYQILHFASKRVSPEVSDDRPKSRRSNYVHEFISLVHRHFRQERSVKFYADKLFISPKYLSLIIKEMTGRSAAEWIDECVILEAKNLLRFSGKNIQQIAYDLNFTNQSSFGKYFKHLTGMSPSEFQKT